MSDIEQLLDTHDTIGLAALVASGQVSSAELVEASITRIETRNPTLNAVVAKRYDAARSEAQVVTAGGPLAGVPFLVKDLNCDVNGLPSTKGSRLFADVVATEDSELTKRFKAAGLLILGNTNTPEMGKAPVTESVLFGPAHNPWNTAHSTGGSSGGSAAAVAGGIVTAGHANDGGGSIRIPASECGLFGLKPTRGRTPTWPAAAAFSYPMGIGHAVTRTVRDSAALLDAIAGPLAGDPYPAPPAPQAGTFLAALDQPLPKLRIGFSTVSPAGKEMHAAGVDAILRTAHLLESLGHEVSEAAPTWNVAMPANSLAVVMGAAGAKMVEDRLAFLGRDLADDDIEPFTRFIHDRVKTLDPLRLIEALQEIEFVSRDVARFYEHQDIWLTATLPVPVPELGVIDTTNVESVFAYAGRFSELTAVFNVTGQPAASVPAGVDANGLPLGVQIVGRHCSEELLLQLAAQIEQAAPWPKVAPWPPSGT
ncbi:MAG: amidase [Acidimicrobiales bacterium]